MRHRVTGRHLGRSTGERLSLYRNLVISLLQHEKMRTTEAKAKEIKSQVEKLISLGKEDTPVNRLHAKSVVGNELLVRKLFEELGPRYATRAGGYTRIFKIAPRKGDGALVVQIELVE